MGCNDCKKIPNYPRRVMVQKQGAAEDDNGQIDQADSNWIDQGRLAVRFLSALGTTFSGRSGMEVQAGDQIQAVAPTTMMTPYIGDSKIPDPTYRLKMGTRTFNIIYAGRVEEVGPEVMIRAIERKRPA